MLRVWWLGELGRGDLDGTGNDDSAAKWFKRELRRMPLAIELVELYCEYTGFPTGFCK
jgi:hypothetical protein